MDRLGITPATNRGSRSNEEQQGHYTFVSGIGQYHTNEPGAQSPKEYLAIGLCEIQALVDTPQKVEKAKAQWLIPSNHPSRNFKEQEAHGEYGLLWADLDNTRLPCQFLRSTSPRY